MLTVLIVEDNIDMLEMLSEVLTLMDYRVYTANNGKHALQVLDKAVKLPDVIISDWHMPHMGGQTLIETLEQMPSLSKIPVIIMSGSDRDMAHALDNGAYAYIAKPFDMDYLYTLLDQLTKKSAST